MKKVWRILKKILLATAALSAASLLIIILTSAIQKQQQLVCRNIQVKIDYDSGISFLSEAQIKELVSHATGGSITGKRLSAIDFRKVETEIRKNPYVKNAEISVDQSQNITVNIIQKRPVLRVINNDGVSYYLGENNDRIPLSDNFTPRVAVALGYVSTHTGAQRDSTVQAALFNMIQYVRKDKFLNALVDQVFVEENGEMEMIPKIEGHIIRFGAAGPDMEEKFDRLKIFYTEGLKRVGWDKYKTIDLRYKGQVICEKQDTTT